MYDLLRIIEALKRRQRTKLHIYVKIRFYRFQPKYMCWPLVKYIFLKESELEIG